MKHKDIIILLSSAFLVVVAWIIFNINHNLVTSSTPEDLTKGTTPINPNFDQPTIDKLNSRVKISPTYDLAPLSSPTPAAVITALPQANSQQSTNAALVASPGGEILQ